MWDVAWLTPWALNPMVLLFVAAVVVTLWNRTAAWWGGRGGITPKTLQQSIVVVAVLSPGESVDPYVRLLDTAKWPARVSVRLLQMLGPQDRPTPRTDTHLHALRITARYGDFDRAHERMRLLREETGAEYTLLLGGPVEADAGWDAALLRLLRRCPARRGENTPVLTAVPPVAKVGGGVEGVFLVVDKLGAVRPRPFAVPPERPQPSLFCSAQFCFGRTAVLARAAPAHGVSADNEDAVLSQSLWMHGADPFAPPASLFRMLDVDVGDRRVVREDERTWAPPGAARRTTREWAHFCGKRAQGKWSRRAQLGLTPGASHEERYAKHGDALQLHGL